MTAHFSDGTQRNVTHQSIYESNYPEIGKVDQEGLITTQSRGGVFAVMARFGEKIAVFQGVVPYHSKGQQNFAGYPSEEKLSKSIAKLLTLDPQTIIYPGHGKHSTIGRELKENPFIRDL